jgi:Protein of unknown function (DUF2800)
MLFNKHSDLVGLHAFLSASKYHWINYDDEKLDRTYTQRQMAVRGTDLHAFAHEAIRLGVRLPKSPKTINLYVNDAIGFRMSSEVVLYYSPNCFGTADCISFRRNLLRIHDLKTGVAATSVKQLEVYAALFCLEYGFKPMSIEIELRIYQSNEVQVYIGDPDVITHIMSKIIGFDKLIAARRLEEMT